METLKLKNESDKSPVEAFMYRYLPYWPLFILLIVICGAGAVVYLKFFAKPAYEVSANIMVEDEKKGADESKLLQALNISSNTIVDNEIEVIQSKELLKRVVDSLMLYAPVSKPGTFVSYSAYASSPVAIVLKNSDAAPDVDNLPFRFNSKINTVSAEGKSYPLDNWVKTSFGVAKFIRNPHLNQAADTGTLSFSINNPKEVVDGLFAKLLATPASKLSSVILLSLTDEVPQRGEDILNSLIQNYYQAALDNKNKLAESTLAFVQTRIQAVSGELDSIENNLQRYKNQKGVVDLGEQSKLYLQNVGDNDRKTNDIDMQLAMLNDAEKYVKSKNEEVGIVPAVTAFRDQPMLNQMLQKLYESQLQYERLKKTVPAGNPNMYSLKNEIDNIRPSILENIQNQRTNLLAGRNTLVAGTGRYMSMLNSVPKKEKELLDISRQQAIKNDAYSFLLQKREETALAYASMVSNSQTINRATASFLPVSPKKMFVYASSFAAAILLGFAFITIKESVTSKILFRTDIEKITSIPIVGEIMSLKRKKPILLNPGNKKDLSAIEQFRQLRYSMGLNSRILKQKKILVTSANAGEGKSFMSNNLALSLASSGKKVVLVDFDLRNPKTSSLFGLASSKGLAEFFEDEEMSAHDIIYPSAENEKLFIIPAGTALNNPTELLLKRDLDKLFDFLEGEFDFIVLDTAPVDPIIDAYVISEYCDAILFVIRHGYSSKTTLESLQKSHKMNAFKNIFIVFNGIKSRGFLNKGYGFGYGYGSNKIYGDKVYQLANYQSTAVRKV